MRYSNHVICTTNKELAFHPNPKVNFSDCMEYHHLHQLVLVLKKEKKLVKMKFYFLLKMFVLFLFTKICLLSHLPLTHRHLNLPFQTQFELVYVQHFLSWQLVVQITPQQICKNEFHEILAIEKFNSRIYFFVFHWKITYKLELP